MRKIMTMMAMLTFAIGMFAKDIKTVVFTTNPQMHCENCENKIKGNLRFEKGIKEITTSVPDQKVTIKYDADKTTPENIIKGFAKIGYTATAMTAEAKKGECCGKKTCAEKGEGCSKKAEGCAKKADNANAAGCCAKKANAENGGCCAKKAEGCTKKADNANAGGCCAKKANAEKADCCDKK